MVAERRCDHPTQGDLGVEVESLEDDLAETKRLLAADEALVAKLVENCGNQSSKWEDSEKSSRVELLTIQETIKLFSDDDALEHFKMYSNSASNLKMISLALSGKSVDLLKAISMIDETVTLPKGEQGKDDEEFIDKVVDVRVVMQRQVPEVQQVQYIDEMIDVPVVAQCQVPTIQTVRKAVDVPQVQFPDRVADVPVVTQRHVPDPLIQEEIVEVILLARVCDSEDFPLNVCHETLLQNKILHVIKKNHVERCLDMLAEIAQLNDDYKKFYEQFVHGNSVDGVEIDDVLRSNTSKPGDKRINFKEYVDRMIEGQNNIYHITGESIAVVCSSPFFQNLRKRGLEAHRIVEPADEHAAQRVKEFDGKMLESTTKEGLDLGDEDEKKTLEELNIEFEPLAELTEKVLGDKGEKVIVSDRIVDSPCVLTASEYGWSANMEHILEAQALRDNSMTSYMVSTAEAQQQHKSRKHQPTKQATQQEREKERESVKKGQRGKMTGREKGGGRKGS